jgi:hypothetical protein
VPRGTKEAPRKIGRHSRTRLSRSMAGLSRPVPLCSDLVTCAPIARSKFDAPATPSQLTLARITLRRFWLFRVRSPLLAESRLMSFPAGTEMFQFPACPSPELWYSFRDGQLWAGRVAPFRDLRIIACCQLPGAYRRLPRLSSALVPRHPPCALREFIRSFSFSRVSARNPRKSICSAKLWCYPHLLLPRQRRASQAQRRYAVFKEQAPHPRPAEARPFRMRRFLEIASRCRRNGPRLFSQS